MRRLRRLRQSFVYFAMTSVPSSNIASHTILSMVCPTWFLRVMRPIGVASSVSGSSGLIDHAWATE